MSSAIRSSLALALTLAACAAPELDSSRAPIIAGTPVADDAYPTIGAMTTNGGGICTGTLISPTTVLTAAHCVHPEILKAAIQQGGGTPPATFEYMFTFDNEVTAESAWLEATGVEWHEAFLTDINDVLDPGLGQWDDIALIHLAAAVEDRAVQPLATPDDMGEVDPEAMNLVAGYGMTDDGDPASAGTLTEGESGVDTLGDHEILAGVGDAQQACRGDSGGPIFLGDSDAVQIGVASRLDAAAGQQPTCTTGLLYTRVDQYAAWIEERVDDLGTIGGDPEPEPGDDDGDDMGGDDGDDDGGGCAAGGSGAGLGGLLLLGVALVAIRRRR
jgi:hypothetical protein